jgi:hypothetical protein
MNPDVSSSWQFWALLSAVFAALTELTTPAASAAPLPISLQLTCR